MSGGGPSCRQSDGRSERRERSHDALKTEGSSGRSSPCRSRQSDAEKATRAVQLMWEKNWPRQCHVAHDDGLAGVFVSATKNVVGPPG